MGANAKLKHEEENVIKDVSHPVKEKSFDEKVFKAVMRELAGTACIVATCSDEGLHGLTATAVCSVSAEPPTILVVVNRSSRTHPHIDVKKAFTVNLLSQEQQSIAELFATKSSDQFSKVKYKRLDDACPVIVDSLAFLHCRVERQFDVGTHTIFLGEVIDGGVADARPLVYYDAAFWKLQPNP